MSKNTTLKNGEDKIIQDTINNESEFENKMQKNVKFIKKSFKLKEKVFIAQESLITEMFENKHIKNIHFIFLMVLLILFINSILDRKIHEDKWSLNINLIISNFSDGHVGIIAWLILFASTLLVYPVLQLWVDMYLKLLKLDNILLTKSWNILWIGIVLLYYYKVLNLVGTFVTEYNLTLSTSFALLMETCRLLMKAHAFIRENVKDVLQQRNKFIKPSKLHFVEFLFMPTLIYKNYYPRTNSINWIKVKSYSWELISCFLFMNYLMEMNYQKEDIYLQVTSNFHIREYYWLSLRNILPNFIIMLIMFYIVLHLIQNLFAELTRFADRQFYQDWWNSRSFGEYFRKWNVLVHEWLYFYIYRDAIQLLSPQSKFIPKFFVFALSSIMHEYILYYMFGMFYPVLGIIFFSFGMTLTSIISPQNWIFNVLFLYGIVFGFSGISSSYFVEYCLRKNPCAINSQNYPSDWLHSKTFFNNCHS